ncbi:acyltransferase family protein [Sphingomicrobium arenosum]|uniref:acyltransferase family protein n=1 Tax=Sphingomicrobium arenosum TaxID=2233861 RepID=UPI00224077BC|nr:acyltransferase [Sphingomicrobium arenosum]
MSAPARRTTTTAMDASVNGLRGITLLLIVLTHYVPTSFFSGNIARPVAATMMVVTGYFLALILERQGIEAQEPPLTRLRRAISLFAQRHIRIWPAIAGVIAMYVLLGHWIGDRTTTQIHDTWPLYLAYMGNVVKMIHETEAFPAHFWLISAQEQFVLATLLACALLGYRNLKSFLVGAVIVGILARLVGGFLWMPDRPALATETPLAVADALALGMLVRMAIVDGTSRTAMRRSLTAAILLLAAAWALLPNTWAFYFTLVPLIAALVGCLFITLMTDEMRSHRIEAFMRAWPWLILLGQMSLSIFLLHPLVNVLLTLGYTAATGLAIDWWLLSLVGPPLSLLVAFLYFRAVEVPLRQMRRRARSSASIKPPAAPSAALAKTQTAASPTPSTA